MQAAPSAADSIGFLLPPARLTMVDVMTVSSYGTDMDSSLRDRSDSSQSHFDADQIEAMSGCVELINTGRADAPDQLHELSDLQRLADRYTFAGSPAKPGDLAAALDYRAQLDVVATACETGAEAAAISGINALLAATGAVPQIAVHDGRGPHLHVSSPTSPLPDRMAAHFAMGLAWLVAAGQSHRIRTCASPSCQKLFVDFSRNSSRRYCDSRTCGNRLHVAAYRARRQQASPASISTAQTP
jgi:predicted RNA-binding Zn ribbon-like protein